MLKQPKKYTHPWGQNPIRNHRGQIAIFVALIFQVLFVIFAMVINVGLIVHDKINLQNSVDLAAYYAGMKQAEVLNSIAHANYQVRQSWKLLAWRLRVLGDMGRQDHPIFIPNISNMPEAPLAQGINRAPSVCIGHTRFTQSYDRAGQNQQSVCRQDNVRVPQIPRVPVIAGFLSFNRTVSQRSDALRRVFTNNCEAQGPLNWYMASIWFEAYRRDIANRKQVIRKLAQLISGSTEDFTELSGPSIREGVEKTLRNNLTLGNRSKLDIKIFNSMGLTAGNTKTWLPDIFFQPHIRYSDFNASGGCQGTQKFTHFPNQLPFHLESSTSGGTNWAGVFDPDGKLRANLVYPTNVPEPGNNSDTTFFYPSSGVEKNPWYMSYVGVSVTSELRRTIFSPFAKPQKITARAFAKPFGGRVGPWYKTAWPAGAPRSQGELLDTHLPPETPTQPLAPNAPVPNYSRYPGDPLGLRSFLALGVFRKKLLETFTKGIKLSWAFWALLPNDLDKPNGDVLAWTNMNVQEDVLPPNIKGTPEPWIRQYEIAAIAPDLFDITYYSIDPRFFQMYGSKAVNSFGEGVKLRADLGSRDGANFNVDQQVELARSLTDPGFNFYVVKDWKHLLTSWAPRGIGLYDFPDAKFARCDYSVPAGSPDIVPGSCQGGGRTGYSVKLVSPEYLLRPDLELGGPGQAGPILNPPPQDF